MSPDGTRWIRHGLFREYRLNGSLASEGSYEHGQEQGLWRDYHDNGVLAAEGNYDQGREVGVWKFWNADGSPQLKG
jgi:antitoxin component YwqK of YwqJK toxin-antitoxin module